MHPVSPARVSGAAEPATGSARGSLRLLLVPAALIALLASFAFTVPQARENPRLAWSILGWAGALCIWWAMLSARVKASGRRVALETNVVRAHYVQALVQGTIYVYWGWYWPDIYRQAPLIVSQVAYLYAFDALMSWTRGRTWRLGFGPLPILFSTNLLLWFRDDWFAYQYAMVTVGALGKEFIRWNREGRNVHVFNPSVFGQSTAAVILLALGLTDRYTRGSEMASAFEQLPNMLIVLFLLGLIVQYLFSVTLMTVAATATLCVVNLVYTGITGTYFFTTITIGATIFLGLHLLVTDPSTSPRSYLGRTIFGVMYGLGYCILFLLLDMNGAPVFWDKLLPVPILNLSVPLIDRFARGPAGALTRRWESALPGRMNLVHMGVWSVLFLALITSGFADGPEKGKTIGFWRQAYKEGHFRAGDNLLAMVKAGVQAESPEAYNMLGVLMLEGDLVPKDEAGAAYWFAQACAAGDPIGCENVAGQFLFADPPRANSEQDVQIAFDALEQRAATGHDAMAAYYVGTAYATGRGRPGDLQRARALLAQGCDLGHPACCEELAQLDAQAAARAPRAWSGR